MNSHFDLRDMQHPVIAAPMVGGPTTPELVAEVSNSGGLGVLAGGLTSAQSLAEQIDAAYHLTTGPVGVNIYVPQPIRKNTREIRRYAETLAGEAERYGVSLGTPHYSDDNWSSKLELVHDLRPDLVSFTFGFPDAREVTRMKSVGIATMACVATADEAQAAQELGFDAIVLQGPKAGGHRFIIDSSAPSPDRRLEDLLAEVISSSDIPVVAAGGLADRADLQRVLQLGAVAGQFGTAFMLADEAGTSTVHRDAFTDPAFTETAVTRAFTGRHARSLRNRFVEQHGPDAVVGFPNVAYLTAPVLAASARAGDPHGTGLWAGTEYRRAVCAPASGIVASLV